MTTAVAMLYPGHAAEDDYSTIESLLAGNAAAEAAVRLPVIITDVDSDEHTVDAMTAVGAPERLADGIRRAAAHRPSSIMWACTSGSFVHGFDGARRQVDGVAERSGCPASSTSLAFVEACRHLGVEHVAIAATYPEPLASRFTGFLTDAGINVVSLSANDIETATAAGTLDEHGLHRMLTSADCSQAQAILVPDTALHTVRWIPGLEERFGKAVLTANQVTAWQGLRLAGFDDPAASFGSSELGRLFSREQPWRR